MNSPSHNDSIGALERNANQSEVIAFLLTAAEQAPPMPVPRQMWFSTPGRPVQDEPLDRLCQLALASRTSEEILGILAELRRRIDLMRGELND